VSRRRVDDHAVSLAFAALEAAGSKPPASHATDEGLDLAIRVWVGILGDLEAAELLAAVVRYLRGPDCRWFPPPGVLLDLVPGRRLLDDSDASFGEVLELVRRYGRGNPPTPATRLEAKREHQREAWALDAEDLDRDQALHDGIGSCGGWRGLCDMTQAQLGANRAAFRSAYRGTRERFHGERDTAVAKRIEGGGLLLLELEDGPPRRGGFRPLAEVLP